MKKPTVFLGPKVIARVLGSEVHDVPEMLWAARSPAPSRPQPSWSTLAGSSCDARHAGSQTASMRSRGSAPTAGASAWMGNRFFASRVHNGPRPDVPPTSRAQRSGSSANSYAGLMLNVGSALFWSNSQECASVRDRGVGGSNPRPDEFPKKLTEFSLLDRSVPSEWSVPHAGESVAQSSLAKRDTQRQSGRPWQCRKCSAADASGAFLRSCVKICWSAAVDVP